MAASAGQTQLGASDQDLRTLGAVGRSVAVRPRTQNLKNIQCWEPLPVNDAVLNGKECEIAIVIYLTAVTVCKSLINPVTNPRTVSSH
jgi:hypothetical protein